MAPDAKLAFTDLGGRGSDGIMTPSDLSRSYYPYPYDVGARVHSDSWGSSSNDYEFMASEVDSFTWDHQVLALQPLLSPTFSCAATGLLLLLTPHSLVFLENALMRFSTELDCCLSIARQKTSTVWCRRRKTHVLGSI